MTTYSWSSLTDGSTTAFDPTADLLDFGSIAAANVEVVALDATTTLFRASGKSATFTAFGVTQIVSRDLFASGYRNVVTSGFSRIIVGDNEVAGGDDGPNVLTGHSIGNDLLLGLGGDDSLSGAGGTDVLDGGAGNDTLKGGTFTSDIATASYASAPSGVTVSLALLGAAQNTGGAGTDTLFNIDNLWGSPFGDQLTGSNGANLIRGGGGDDTLDGGGGTDTVDYSDAGAGVTVNLGLTGAQNTGSAGVDTLANFENVTGSSYGDTLTGSATADVLDGGAGDDMLSGMGGADRLVGGSGDDTLSGGDGNDTLFAGIGNDVLDGGGDIDTADFSAATQAVKLDLGAGTAIIGEGPVRSLLSVENAVGTSNADMLTGSSGNNSLSGGNGNDTLAGLDGDDTLNGGSGTDTASYAAASTGVTVNLSLTGAQPTGGAGSHTLISIERLLGSSFADTLIGNSNANIIDGGLGDDVLDGGGGRDTVSFISASGAVFINLGLSSPQNTGAGIDTLLNFEDVEGSAFADQLTGNDAANELSGYLGDDTIAGLGGADTLSGGDGNDYIHGGDEDDILSGGLGNDLLNGGAGYDRVSYLYAAGAVSVDLGVVGPQTTGEGNDTLVDVEDVSGSAFADTLIGDGVANGLHGNNGNDTLIGLAGNDTLAGWTGSDQLDGGEGNDSLDGSYGPDTLLGGLGDDLLKGGASDYYSNGNSYDYLPGTDGDSMAGGAGNDTYQVTATSTQLWFEYPGGYSLVTSTGFLPDLVSENPVEGTDTVETYVSYALPANVENLVLMERTFDINGTGNALDNILTGNSRTNVLDGAEGNDTLYGGAGNDTLTGGAGSDTFTAASNSGVDTVTDFAAGAGGDRAEVVTGPFLNYSLGSNPFASGHARLTQSGADTLLELDKDGAGAAFPFQTALILKNVVTGSLVPENLIWSSANQAPSGADKTVSTNEDNSYTFTTADFGFSDPADSPANGLLAVRISALPGAGSLTFSGVPVTPGQSLSAAELAAGQLVFTPTGNENGTGYTSFTFQVQDDGGTASGGADVDPTPNVITVDVTPVNDAPSGADKTISMHEDNAYTFSAADFGFSDPADSPANTLLAVHISALPGAGSLRLSGASVTPGQSISAAELAAGQLVFTPTGNENGTGYTSFTFQVQDDGGTASGGADLDPTPNVITVDVTPVNDAPSGADKTISMHEENAYTFSAADFGFSDPADNPADGLLAVRISALPGAGSLTFSGVPVTPGQFLSAAELAAGQLVFTPTGNENGTGYTSFTFQVQDDGGTASGGADLDPTPNVITVDVTPVNDAPSGADKTISMHEDNAYTFSAADFGFSDPADSPANTLLAVHISALPGAGSLRLSGASVTPGQSISAAELAAGQLVFTPTGNENGTGYTSFTFQVQDEGGTASGGADLDPTPNVITVDVTPVNDAPSGADKAISMHEDNAYTFSAADFGFSDPADSPANALLAVRISALPGAGSLTFSGVPVTPGQSISAAELAAGQLVFTPTGNENGTGYTSFTFQVQDEGGTASGGADLDPTPNVITVDVQPLIGTNDDDHLVGGPHNNFLDGGAGNDTLDGGSGNDTASYASASSGVNVDLSISTAQATGGSGSDTLISIENLIGSEFNDRLTGNSGANRLEGGAGSDSLRGGGGADTLVGGDDRDYYYVYNASDVVIENNASTGSGDSDLVFSYLADYTLTANVERLWLFSNNANGTGNSLDNSLYASSGNNVLDGGAGNDTLDGGSGNDTASYASASSGVNVDLSISTAQATGGSGSDTLISIENLIGSQFADRLTGNSGANRLEGGAGSDSLRGGGGADTLVGGDDRDYYYVYNASDVVIETNASTGSGDSDLVFSYLSDYTLTANVERLWLFANNANGTGNSLDNSLYASSGNNVLDGGAGNDTLDGGSGNDTASYASAGSGVTADLSLSTAQATGGSGSDTLISIENLIGSQYSDRLTGNSGANRLEGGAGSDSLRGGGGADTLVGGDDRDYYYVYNASDVVIETNASTGSGDSDLVFSYLSDYTLTANVERLWLFANNANGTGNSLDNSLYASSGNNVLDGGAGNDTLDGGSGNDTASYASAGSGVTADLSLSTAQATGGSGSDTLISIENLIGSQYSDRLTGNSGANRLEGGAGSDSLRGGGGADTLVGGDDRDYYYVYNASDVVIETNASTGSSDSDLVFSYVSDYTLTANVERLWLFANNANGTGNSLDNSLYASSGNNVLDGGAGNDTLDGGSGNDTASYASASSAVTVGLGIATAQATGGSDSDTLISIENLIGSQYSDRLTGNSGANRLEGGAGSDSLRGGGGADTLVGGDDRDYYYVYNTGDVVVETNASTGSGDSDLVFSYLADYTLTANVERLWLFANNANGTGNSLDNSLYASSGNNVLDGGAGNDTLNGGVGNDTLTGGSGADLFRFDSLLNALSNRDTITDFNVAADTLELENAIFGSLTSTGTLAAASFRSGAGVSAADANDFILYDSASGALSYDADGNGGGAAVQFASLSSGLALSNADFLVT